MNNNQYDIIMNSVEKWNKYILNLDNNADLGGAYLRGADLRDAHLGGADLSDAHLSDADLGGAYLRGADLGGAYLSGSIGIKILGQCSRGFLFYAVANNGLMIKSGCQWFTYDEAISHWSNHHDEKLRKEILMYVEMAKNLAELYEWI